MTETRRYSQPYSSRGTRSPHAVVRRGSLPTRTIATNRFAPKWRTDARRDEPIKPGWLASSVSLSHEEEIAGRFGLRIAHPRLVAKERPNQPMVTFGISDASLSHAVGLVGHGEDFDRPCA